MLQHTRASTSFSITESNLLLDCALSEYCTRTSLYARDETYSLFTIHCTRIYSYTEYGYTVPFPLPALHRVFARFAFVFYSTRTVSLESPSNSNPRSTSRMQRRILVLPVTLPVADVLYTTRTRWSTRCVRVPLLRPPPVHPFCFEGRFKCAYLAAPLFAFTNSVSVANPVYTVYSCTLITVLHRALISFYSYVE